MSFQVGSGSLGGAMFFQVGLCTPLRTMHYSYFCFFLPGSQNRFIIKNSESIADYIKSMAALGFGPTMLEFQDLVKDFVEMKSIKTHFTNNRPGYDWVQSFPKHHKLIFKKEGQM